MDADHLRVIGEPDEGHEARGDAAEETPTGPWAREEAQWPPRVDQPRRLPFTGTKEAPLRLDESTAPKPEHEFQRGRLLDQEGPFRVNAPGRRECDRAPVPVDGRAKAHVFDPKNPSGRSAADALFDANDEDHARRRRRVLAAAMGQGAVLGLLVMGSAASPSLLLWLWAAVAGGIGGAVARGMGDGPEGWLVGMGLTGAGIGLVLGGLPAAFAPPGAAALGWIGGLVRDTARR